MTVEFLYSVHGTALVYDPLQDRLVQAAGPHAPRNAGLATDDGVCRLVYRDGDVWRPLGALDRDGHIGKVADGAPPLLLRRYRHMNDLISIEGNGVCLGAPADGSVVLARQTAGQTEAFYPIDPADAAFLDEIADRIWIASGSGLVAKIGDPIHGIAIVRDFHARIGLLYIPIRDLLAARHRRFRGGWSIVYDHWRVEHLIPFRPLIYMIAYGKQEIFETMALLLQTLWEFGQYDGEVLIFSDRDLAALQPYIPPELRAKTKAATAPVRDITDMMAIKYRICDMPELDAYRPLLYLDTDIVCNAPIEPLLRILARTQRICVPLELDLRGAHNYYGSLLFATDTAAPIRNDRGFSAGLLGIPSTEIARQTFPLILDSMFGLARQQPRRESMDSIFYDQGIANYVMHKTDAADFDIMTQHVVTPVDFHRPLSTIERRGFAHFCGGVGDAQLKLSAMRAYVAHLREGPQSTITADRNE